MPISDGALPCSFLVANVGALAGGVWWVRGTEARGVTLEDLERVPEPAGP